MSKQLFPIELENYSIQYTTPESEILYKLNRETHLKVPQAVMLSGHLQGALLQMISHMVKPKNVLEIGTYTGYSAICLAQGLQQGGMLHTIDNDIERFDMALSFFCTAGLQDKIKQHIGEALNILPTLNASFDLVFIDADKVNYAAYYDLVFDKVIKGGYILADNVLYEGETLLPTEKQSKNAKAISLFNEKVKADNRIEHVLLPIRDGLMIMRKI